MKNFFCCCLFLVAGGFSLSAQDADGAAVQPYIPVNDGSSVTFEIKNLGFNTKGSFTGLSGKIFFDLKDVTKAAFDVSLDAGTIHTDNEMRDDHLKKETYFDVANHPRIRFVSTGVTRADKSGHYTVSGKLTIKNTTKDISFPFLVTPMGDDLIFSGKFTIGRKDFDIGGSSTLSNSLTVSLSVLARK
jgi:polyisoprenoid-binding protein YceI